MKLLPFLFAVFLTIPLAASAQSTGEAKKPAKEYRKRTSSMKSGKDTSDVTSILKDSSNAESGPILEDNGTVNSTGVVDGSRSSTGRPDADTSGSYSVKKRKTSVRTVPGKSKP